MSGPYRGIGGFLQTDTFELDYWGTKFPAPIEVWVGSYETVSNKIEELKGFRPLSRYGWVPTEVVYEVTFKSKEFPSPLEVWVGSYSQKFS